MRPVDLLRGTIFAVFIAALNASVASAQTVLPRPEPPFDGKIGRTAKDSISDSQLEMPSIESICYVRQSLQGYRSGNNLQGLASLETTSAVLALAFNRVVSQFEILEAF
jgi:hypothetical protein